MKEIILQHPQALFKLNAKLSEHGLPFYYQGGTSFNTEYRAYPTPRWVFRWTPPFMHLDEIYLSYKVGSAEQLDIVYSNTTNTLKIFKVNGKGAS